MGKTLVGCPECEAPRFYMGGSVCTSCDWHGPGQTLMHADFARDPGCRWCTAPTTEPDRRLTDG